ncbi:hypothetical protein AJ88_28740 [Mesorhizobium amorphae CCBAU 01583]|nr:hypothetical protein AJ88_28740 [Mesorhizobium amorphae CCBAU 01583]
MSSQQTAGQVSRDRKFRSMFMQMMEEPLGLLIERLRVFAQEPCTIPAGAVDDRSLWGAVHL